MRRAGAGPERLLAAYVFAVLAAGCAGDRAPLTVAAVGGWSGPEETELRRGIELGVAAVNREGGARRHPLQVVFKDDRNENGLASQFARELVADRGVLAVIGHTRSDPTLIASKVYDGVMPVVTARFTSPDVAGVSRWVFQMVPTDSAYSAAVVRAATAHHWNSAAVLFNNTARGRATAEQFKALYKGRVVSLDPAGFPAPQPGDLKTYVEYHRSQNADMVYAPIGEPKEYIREAQLQGLRAAVVGWDVWSLLRSDPTLPGEFHYVAPFDLSRADARTFVEQYRAAHHAEPGPFAALGYDAVRLVAFAIGRGGTDRQAIRDAIAGLTPSEPFRGAIGPLSFAPDGTPVGPEPVVLPLPGASAPGAAAGGSR